MARYRVLSWHGIPAQVKARDEQGHRVSRLMPDWFGQEVDRVAMREGVTGTDAYLEAWTWSEESERPGGADEVADAVILEHVTRWGRGG